MKLNTLILAYSSPTVLLLFFNMMMKEIEAERKKNDVKIGNYSFMGCFLSTKETSSDHRLQMYWLHTFSDLVLLIRIETTEHCRDPLKYFLIFLSMDIIAMGILRSSWWSLVLYIDLWLNVFFILKRSFPRGANQLFRAFICMINRDEEICVRTTKRKKAFYRKSGR